MSSKKVAFCLLAAGKGTRLGLECPKPLAPLFEKKMIDWVLEPIFPYLLKGNALFPILGHKKEEVSQHLSLALEEKKLKELCIEVYQEKQLGTGHALQCAVQQYPQLLEDYETVIVSCGDTPLLKKDVFSQLMERQEEGAFEAVGVSFIAENPQGFGRIVRGNQGEIRIKEEKEASREEKEIKEVNAGIYIFKSSFLKKFLFSLTPSPLTKEIYLTDLIEKSSHSYILSFKESEDFLGVNTLEQLSCCETILRKRFLSSLQQQGVRILMPETVYIGPFVSIKSKTTIHAGTHLSGDTVIGGSCSIGPYAVIKNSVIEEEVKILEFSSLENSQVGARSSVGPFARLRPDSVLQEEVKVGNFVEIKKANLENNVKVSHLSYIGDAEVGEDSNIGCGFITCNYDGEKKHKTVIGKRCFIGSDTQAVAPIRLGDDCLVAAGTTLVQSLPEGSFAISRTPQKIKPNYKKRKK